MTAAATTDTPRPRVFAAALLLAAVAGWVDAIAFIVLGGYFVSFMSGNTTAGAVQLVNGGTWGSAAIIIGAFLLGVFAATVLQHLVHSSPQAVAMAVVVVGFAVASGCGAAGAPGLVTSAVLAAGTGAMNTVFARESAASFGITYMTGSLVKAAQGAAGALFGQRGTTWPRYLVLWVAIAVGAIAGTVVYDVMALAALWPATVVVTAVAVWLVVAERRDAAS